MALVALEVVGDMLPSSTHCWAFSGHPGEVPAAFRGQGWLLQGTSGVDAPRAHGHTFVQ